MSVRPEFILEAAKELQEIRVTPERARELAAEVDRLNSAVRAASAKLDFDAEPNAFSALLAAHAR
jgi:hypothetical protein